MSLSTGEQVLPQFNNSFQSLVKSILTSVETRFSSFCDNEVIVSAEVFDPANFPKEDDLAGYGVKEIGVLLKHFKNILEAQGCDIAAVARE